MSETTDDTEPIDQLLMEAAWRHSMIAGLVKENDPERRAEYRQFLLSMPAHHPRFGEITLKPRTLRRWCQHYREKGLRGLVRRRRSDRGILKALPDKMLERALELRIEDGRRSVPMLLKLLANENPEWEAARSTLDRHLRARGSTRKRRGPEGPFTSFEASEPLALLQGDVLHGPVVLVGDKPCRCRVVGWLDDHSRFLCHLQAYPNERLPAIEDSLKQVILKYGLVSRVFVDNAWVYSGKSFSLACAELGIAKIHSTPRYPVSRGKIERVFRTLREQLLQEVENLEPLPIEELNRYLQGWVNVYHKTVHSATEQTPMDRFEGRPLRPVPNADFLEQAFWQWSTRTVSGHGEIKFQSNIYRVDPSFSRRKVVVRYDPFDLSRLYIWQEGRRVATATPERLKRDRCAGRPMAPRTQDSDAARAYLEGLAKTHDQNRERELNLTSYPADNEEAPRCNKH